MRGTLAVIKRNLTNFTRNKLQLIFSVSMPLFMMFIFSFTMKSSSAGMDHPLNYLISGIIIMSVFQAALSNSTNILEDISCGFMKEIIVSPIPRWQISIGQVLSSSIIALLQGLIIIIIGLFAGLDLSILQFIEMFLFMILTAVTFSSLGLFLASVAKTSTTFQAMISVFTIPLTFLSGAYIPTTSMPGIVRPFIYINPLTYTTAIFRYISLKMNTLSDDALVAQGVAFKIHGFIIEPYAGIIIISLMFVIFFSLCVSKFNKADFSNVKVFNPEK